MPLHATPPRVTLTVLPKAALPAKRTSTDAPVSVSEKATPAGRGGKRLADDDETYSTPQCCFDTSKASSGAVVAADNVQLAAPRQTAANNAALPL